MSTFIEKRKSHVVLVISQDHFYQDVLGKGCQVVLRYRTHVAKNFKAAVDILKHVVPDVVVLDLDPSRKEALDFVSETVLEGRSDRCDGILVIAIAEDGELRESALKAGCGALMTKQPFHIRDLRDLIEGMLQQRES